ncbi:MAG TPA: carboxypeptidase regulatory-like domain-containing protein, partial [Ferruginibacter sp.]|nr:carboxypeptidase regulatory-like domain-containing protein [Ferruginibacter sp.]
MKSSVLFVFLFLGFTNAHAQKISGFIKKDAGDAASAATIALLKSSDSSIVKYASIKKDGQFEFLNIATGNYFIKASHIGYKTIFVPLEVLSSDVSLNPIVLVKDATSLAGVTVSSA